MSEWMPSAAPDERERSELLAQLAFEYPLLRAKVADLTAYAEEAMAQVRWGERHLAMARSELETAQRDLDECRARLAALESTVPPRRRAAWLRQGVAARRSRAKGTSS